MDTQIIQQLGETLSESGAYRVREGHLIGILNKIIEVNFQPVHIGHAHPI